MSSKEEILEKSFNKNIKSIVGSLDFKAAKGEAGYNWIYEAMGEYAKQEVISYEIWLDAELNNDSTFNYGKTPEQLYELYKSQSK